MEHVKLREKIGYGLGDAASSMFWKLFTMYLLFFYTDVVGNCLTAEEAIILKGKIASTFPKAFVKSEEFSMADLLN